jgi:hypothetical protein
LKYLAICVTKNNFIFTNPLVSYFVFRGTQTKQEGRLGIEAHGKQDG